MQPERVRLHYSDGQTEWRNPPTVLEIGTEVRRGGRTWIVASIQPEEDVVTIMLRRFDGTDARPTPHEPVSRRGEGL
jgi:hypothetical protein